jgi:hypothetical protein
MPNTTGAIDGFKLEAVPPADDLSSTEEESRLKKSRDSTVGTCTRIQAYFSRLDRNYGLRFLILCCMTTQLLKGFCRAQSSQSARFLVQLWNIPGPKIDTFTAISDIPWSMKPVVAVLSDLYPLFGFRKIPYITIGILLGISGLCLVSFIPPELSSIQVPIFGLFLANFCWMTADILVEGLFARRIATHPETGPDFILFVSIGQQVAYLFSSVISGAVLESGLPNNAQWNIAICLLPTAFTLYPVLANFGSEVRISSKSESHAHRKEQWARQRVIILMSILTGSMSLIFAVAGLVLEPTSNFILCVCLLVVLNLCSWAFFSAFIGKLVLFLSIVAATNVSISGPAHYFYTDSESQYPEGPHFGPYFFVTICGLVGAVTAIIATCLFAFFKGAKYRAVYMVLILLNGLLSAPNSLLFSRLNRVWGISDYVFVGTDTATQTAIAALFFAPGLLMLSRICPDQLESSMFAILAANTNFAITASGPISGFICDSFGITPDGSRNESQKFENMWIANILMVGLKLIPLLFIWMLPNISMTEPFDDVRESVTLGSPFSRFMIWTKRYQSTDPAHV